MLELLVVTAILAVLAALLLPTVAQAKKKAQQTQCMANLHQLDIALHGYLADNEAYPVSIYCVAVLYHQGYLGTPPAKRVLYCPSAQWDTNKIGIGFTPISYSYNAYGVAQYPQPESLGIGGQFITSDYANPPTRESDVAQPADMMVLGDNVWVGTLFSRRNLADLAEYGNIFDRHQGKANVLFCDSHIESPTLAYLEDTNDVALARWNRDHQPHRDMLPP